MKDAATQMHYVGKEISPEQFIIEHTFVYVIKGILNGYDGSRQETLKSGECCLARKDRLARYNKEKVNSELEKVFVFFDETFLINFQQRHQAKATPFKSTETFVWVKKNDLLPGFIQSLQPYYNHGKINEPFADVKREELLIILLQAKPELAGLFFDYGIPEKVSLEEFMNRNFKFNVSIERFAYLTGRSLSAFKRDFQQTFKETPGRWLVSKRLSEAYFLIHKKDEKPSDIYLDLGFETLAHFSYAFKKQFKITPTELTKGKKMNNR